MAEPKVSLAGRVEPEVYDEVMRIASDEDRTQMRPLPDEPLDRSHLSPSPVIEHPSPPARCDRTCDSRPVGVLPYGAHEEAQAHRLAAGRPDPQARPDACPAAFGEVYR